DRRSEGADRLPALPLRGLPPRGGRARAGARPAAPARGPAGHGAPAPDRRAQRDGDPRPARAAARSVVLRQTDADSYREVRPAGVGEAEGARLRVAGEPAELEQPRHEGPSERARDVVALLGPVEAAARDVAGASLDPQLGEGARAVVGDAVVAGAVAGDEYPALLQRVCDGNAQPAREVVVAAAGVAD